MTSNDQQQYLTVELFNSKMDTFMAQFRLENEKLRSELKADIQGLRSELKTDIQGVRSEIQGVRSELKGEIQAVQSEVRLNSARLDMLVHTFYWGFAIMTVVIAIVAVFVPYFLRERKEKQQETQSGLTEDRVQNMISQALANFNSRGKTAV